jgi:hypothetical protein
MQFPGYELPRIPLLETVWKIGMDPKTVVLKAATADCSDVGLTVPLY